MGKRILMLRFSPGRFASRLRPVKIIKFVKTHYDEKLY